MIFLRAQKSKSGKDTAAALEDILTGEGSEGLKMLYTDKGREFWSRETISVLQRHSVLLMSSENSDIKASRAERAVKQVRQRIARLLQEKKSFRYVDQLPAIQRALNDAYNRVIKMSARQALSADPAVLFERRYGRREREPPYPFRFKVGQRVRAALPSLTFEHRETRPKFSLQLHRIVEARDSKPHTYRLELLDRSEESVGPVAKGYYSPELSLVTAPPGGEAAAVPDGWRSLPRRRPLDPVLRRR